MNFRYISVVTICIFTIVYNIFAQTDGPIQREFVGSSGVVGAKVDEFTGDFNFGIPVITVPGANGFNYSLNLTYKSGTSPMEASSWVGFGWSLSPGAIIRGKNGFPDDYKGAKIRKWYKIKPNITVSVAARAGMKSFSSDLFNIDSRLYYNNYKGYQVTNNYGFLANTIQVSFSERSGIYLNNKFSIDALSICKMIGLGGLYYTNSSYRNDIFPHYEGTKIGGEISFTPDFGPQAGPNTGIDGIYDRQEFIPMEEKYAFGAMYSADAKGDDDIMDYSSDRSSIIESGNKYLPTPYGGEDNFIITGSGMSGSFKFHHLKYGDYHPEKQTSYTTIESLGLMINAGTDWGVGGKISAGSHSLSTGVGSAYTPFHQYTKGDGSAFFLMNGDLGYQEYYGNNPGNLFHEPVRASIHNEFFNSSFEVKSYDLTRNMQSKGSYSIDYVTRKEIAQDIKQFITSYQNKTINSILYGNIEDKYDSHGNMVQDWTIDYHDEPGLNYYPQFSSFEKKTFQLFRQWTSPEDIWRYYHYFDDAMQDEVEELQITNPNGSVYVYGQPVYARNERDLSYGVDLFSLNNAHSKDLKTFFSITTAKGTDRIIGTESEQPYVCAYLLTQILSPDYVDITMNGPSPDDLGDYVKFTYRLVESTPWKTDYRYERWSSPLSYDGHRDPNSQWSDLLNSCAFYKWRFPYNGLDLSLNSLSNNEDDYAHVRMGEREVYYLESIETKTHIAYFVTNHTNIVRKINNQDYHIDGDGIERNDGWEASHNEWETTGNPLSNYMKDYYNDDIWTVEKEPGEGNPQNKMQNLEKIMLFQKDPLKPDSILKLVQTTRFDYNYEIWPNCINTLNSNREMSGLGKLTLKKVWFESNNVKNIKISPYYFDYEYPTGIYPPEYSSLEMSYSINDQKPNFSEYDIDRWGNYMKDGLNLRRNLNPYVPQSENPNFDPAAWNLKKITLPGGAQIHVQYEQKDYLYVQDRIASVMAPISQYEAGSPTLKLSKSSLMSLFPAISPDTLISFMNKQFVEGDKLLYCRLLHDFYGAHLSGTSLWESDNYPICSMEYLDSYVKVKSVTTLANSDLIDVKIDGAISPHPFWTEVCRDYYYNNKISDYGSSQNCYGEHNNLSEGAEATIRMLGGMLFPIVSQIADLFTSSSIGNDFNTHLSYLRIPVTNKKLGGGIRVKRLLYLDEFNKHIQNADKNDLYGYEYIYKDEFGRSSGIATNEPQYGKEANSLVEPLDATKNDRKFYQFKYLSGDYLVKYLGPIGQSLLPAPSVGYSRVIVKNIFEGKTDQGLSINEYYTCKDYPFDMQLPTEQNDKSIKAFDNTDVAIPDGYVGLMWGDYSFDKFSVSNHETKLSQGYQFILNSMNGKLKKSILLGGRYLEINYSDPEYANKLKINLSSHVSSETSYEYFQPGESIPMFYGFKNVPDPHQPGMELTENDIRLEYPGRITTFCSESIVVKDHVNSLGANFDLTIFPVLVPAPISSFIPSIAIQSDDYESYVTNKTISYPAILKEITQTTEGVTNKIQNVAFDPRAGIPVIQRFVDGYDNLLLGGSGSNHDGAYYNYTFLASAQYPNFTQINESEKNYPSDSKEKFLLSRRANDYELQINSLYGSKGCDEKFFGNGDLLRLKKEASDAVIGYFWIEESTPNLLRLVPLFNHDFTGSFSFSGTSFDIPVSGPDYVNTMAVDIEILKSGRNNILTASAGSVTTYGQTDVTKPIGSYTFEPKPPVKELDDDSKIELAARNQFVEALNNELQSLTNQPGNDVEANWSYGSNTFPFRLLDDNGRPAIINSTNPLLLYIHVKKLLGKISYEISHQYSKILNLSTSYQKLADDLNKWLDKSWNIDISRYFPDKHDWGVGSDCDDEFDPECDKMENQKFINERINLLWPQFFDNGVGDKINEITGLNQILNSHYLIQGRWVKGKEIFQKNITSSPVMSYDPDLDNGLSLIIDNRDNKNPHAYIGISWLFVNTSYIDIAQSTSGYNLGFARHFNEYGNYSDPYYALHSTLSLDGLFNISRVPKGGDIRYDEEHFYMDKDYLDYSEFLSGLSARKSDRKNVYRFLEPVQKVGDLLYGIAQTKSLFTWHKAWIKPPMKILRSSDFINDGSEHSTDSKSDYTSAVDASNVDLINQLNLDPDKFHIYPDPTYRFTSNYGHFIIDGSAEKWLTYEVIDANSKFYDYSGDPYHDGGEGSDPNDIKKKPIFKLGNATASIPNQCAFWIEVTQGQMGYPEEIIKIDPETGQLTYEGADCNSNVCISFPDVHFDWKFQNVVNSSAATYTDNWENNFSLASISSIPDYFNKNNIIQEARKGKWRSSKNLIYSGDVTSSGTVGGGTTPIKGYDNGGLLQNGCSFNWNSFNKFSPAPNGSQYGWFVGDSITKRDRHGRVIESIDNNGIFSSIKYDALGNNNFYTEALPSIQAVNADTNEIFFESFESYLSDQPQSGNIVLNNAHTGRKSKLFKWSSSNETEYDLHLSYGLHNEITNRNCDALIVDLWLKTDPGSWLVYADESDAVSGNKIYCELAPTSGSMYHAYGRIKAIVDQWALLEFRINSYTAYAPNDYTIKLHTLSNGAYIGKDFYIDDIRIIPECASAACFVYDTTDHKLLATLNNDHFAIIYQYNYENSPVRVIAETYNGKKTVSESQANILKSNRSDETFQFPQAIQPFNNYWNNFNNNGLLPDQKDQNFDEKFNIFHIEITPKGKQMKILDKNIEIQKSDSTNNKANENVKSK